MSRPGRRGFSLIELLTVIAIIAILAGLTAATLPRVLERARVTSAETAAANIKTALATYFTDNGSYPLGYGYRKWDSRGKSRGQLPDSQFFNLLSYMTLINFDGVTDLYDRFSESYDTNRDGVLSALEFSPSLRAAPAAATVLYPTGDLGGIVNNPDTYDQLDGADQRASSRPFVYIPVYSRHAKRIADYYNKQADPLLAAKALPPANVLDPILRTTPPPKLDAYVLVSVGPSGSTYGLLSIVPLGNIENLYYLTALRAYYLLTRDIDGNGVLDFDFRARTRNKEAAVGGDKRLPDPKAPNGAGPLIFNVEG